MSNPMPPGDPYGSPQFGPPYQTPPPSAPPEKKRFFGKGCGCFVLLGVLVLGLAGWSAYSFLFKGSKGPITGNCVQYDAAGRHFQKVVKCSAPTANAIVLKRFDVLPITRSCQGVPGTIGQHSGSYRSGHKRRDYLVCFGPHTPGRP
ncbi:hypothetical protein ABT095_28235 [Kitasatospora sp. NPDC002227]|uniref:hypothetical protein n=1 Tax=Kitasatospora sp. NPDC002227 TaxID=3154773 RepID=UPI00332B36B8